MNVKPMLADFESSHLIEIGKKEGLKRSTVTEAASLDPGRTSKTAWINREKSIIVDAVIRRIADVVQIPEEKLWLQRWVEKSREMNKNIHSFLSFTLEILFVLLYIK